MSLGRGIQSVIFHYLSCAPCTGYLYRVRRRKQAKRERKQKAQLEMDQPELYRHPEPSATNPFWAEEIFMGPGPPPRRNGRKANTSSQRGITTADTYSTLASNGGSSLDIGSSDGRPVRVSEDTLSGENWNRRRYQREDEELWGFGEAIVQAGVAGSSVGIAGISRPRTARTAKSAKSSGESYYRPLAPPVNDLHPPIVSLPLPHPADNTWMLQPPPRARIMNGKERATNRSRSGSGTSSRVELNLQRQVSAKQLQAKRERGETPEVPPLSRGSSHRNAKGQRHDRDPKAARATPPSASSSRRKRRDTTAEPLGDSSTESSDTVVYPSRNSSTPQLDSKPSLKILRARSSRQKLSTVVSSGEIPPRSENLSPKSLSPPETDKSSDSVSRATKQRPPLAASDLSSLNVLQDLVSPRALLNSGFVSAPLMESRIKLPEADPSEDTLLVGQEDASWVHSDFGESKECMDEGRARTPARDPRMRWSVDF